MEKAISWKRCLSDRDCRSDGRNSLSLNHSRKPIVLSTHSAHTHSYHGLFEASLRAPMTLDVVQPVPFCFKKVFSRRSLWRESSSEMSRFKLCQEHSSFLVVRKTIYNSLFEASRSNDFGCPTDCSLLHSESLSLQFLLTKTCPETEHVAIQFPKEELREMVHQYVEILNYVRTVAHFL